MQSSKLNIEFLPPHQIIGNKWYPIIEQMLIEMRDDTEGCRKAFFESKFTKRGLGQVLEKGLIIGSATLLNDWSYKDAQVKVSKELRIAGWKELMSAYAITFIPAENEADQRPRIFFGSSSMETLLTSPKCWFRECLIHELLHCAGVPAKKESWIWQKMGYHDLAHMKGEYTKITKACGCK